MPASVCLQIAPSLRSATTIRLPLTRLPTARQMPVRVIAQRPPDLPFAFGRQRGEESERIPCRVDPGAFADLSKAENMIRMPVNETPPRRIEHQVDALFLFVLRHPEAVRAQPEIAQRLLQDGEIKLLLQAGVDHDCTVQSATT